MINPTPSYFNQHYPWPDEILTNFNPIEMVFSHDSDLEIDILWPYFSDSNFFAKLGGFPKREYREVGGQLHGKDPRGQWIEEWTWIEDVGVMQTHDFYKGIFRYFRGIVLTEEIQLTKSRIHLYFGLVPKNMLSTIMFSMQKPRMEKLIPDLMGKMEDYAREQKSKNFLQNQIRFTDEQNSRLEHNASQLRNIGFKDDLVDKLELYIRHTDDDLLGKIRLLPLVSEWEAEKNDVISLLLHAVDIGLLDLRWDAICPHCQNTRQSFNNLSELQQSSSCEPCMIDFNLTGSNALEVAFQVNAAIRSIDIRPFCSSAPTHRAHIKLHQEVDANTDKSVLTRLESGRYRMRIKGEMNFDLLDIGLEDKQNELVWNLSNTGTNHQVGNFPLIRLENETNKAQTFVLESSSDDQCALRPIDLFNFPTFRRLFPAEAIAEGMPLEIGTQHILFTDIVGSTAFYNDVGDTMAFIEVRKHFSKMFQLVENQNGTVVKTVGDAVMAAFQTPKDAFLSAEQIQLYFRPNSEETKLRLRITIHSGHCMAVNGDTGIDYFGTTVNLAAKLQSIAEAGQVAITENVYKDPALGEYLSSLDYEKEELDFALKEEESTVSVVRFEIS